MIKQTLFEAQKTALCKMAQLIMLFVVVVEKYTIHVLYTEIKVSNI